MVQDFSALIDRVIRERFGDVIESVRAVATRDFEGDRIFQVDVVFKGAGPLDDELTASVVRHIRKQLRDKDDDTFPIISFISAHEAKPEAA